MCVWRGETQRSPLHRKAKNDHESLWQDGSNLVVTTCSEFLSPTIFQVASSKSVAFSLPFLRSVPLLYIAVHASIHVSIVRNARKSFRAENTSQMALIQLLPLTAACLQSSDSSPATPQFIFHSFEELQLSNSCKCG